MGRNATCRTLGIPKGEMMPDHKNNPSIYGYFNWQEARAVVLAVVGADAFTQLGITLLLSLLKHSDTIYVGPNSQLVSQISGMIAALLAGYVTRKRFVLQGE